MDTVESYYMSYDEDNRLFRSRARNIEYITTLSVIRSVIKHDFVVADIGAATGVYTIEIAPLCKQVTAIDLVEKHIAKLDVKIKEKGIKNIRMVNSSILDYSVTDEDKYDLVLCFGPYYHLRNKEEREKCLSICFQLLKNNGILLLAYINKQAVLTMYNSSGVFFSEEQYMHIEENTSNPGIDTFMDVSYYAEPTDVEKSVEMAGFRVTDNLGVDGIYNIYQEQLEKMDNRQWEAFQKYHLTHCNNKSIIGLSNHGLIICQKD